VSQLELTMALEFATPVHTTGSGWALHVDRPTARGADGQVVIPATSLKGALRAAAVQVLGALGVPACSGSIPGSLCTDPARLCLVCRVFGHPRRRAPIRFTDARPASVVETRVRPSVAISRARRAAFEQRLFAIEVADPTGAERWQARAAGRFGDPQPARDAAALIWLAARARPTLGGGVARGVGWIRAWEVEARLNGEPLGPEALEAAARGWTADHRGRADGDTLV